MSDRHVIQTVQARPLAEGAGVTVHRTIGTPAMRNLDPFLMLDHFGSDNPNEYIAGFPDHPHRGFITVTYMIDGHMLHQDSMGNRGDLRAGGVQWMKAASGIIHSEMPQQTAGLMRGFQLWINLPANEKMSAPAYQEFSAELIPTVATAGAEVKVICGDFEADGQAHVAGPISDPHTQVRYFDLALKSDSEISVAMPTDHVAFVYVYEGSAAVAGEPLPEHALALTGAGERITVTSGPAGARAIVVGGKPLKEPIVQYGPFVMTSRTEIERAIGDYHAGRLVQSKAAFNPQ